MVLQVLSNTPLVESAVRPSMAWEYSRAAWAASLASMALFLPSAICFSRKISWAWARLMLIRVFTVSLLRSVDGAWRKFSLM